MAEKKLKEWVNDKNHSENNLARFVRYRVKGGEKELRVMTGFVGDQSDYQKSEGKPLDESRITASFWEGLSDDELFRYSYASRSSMASKKLDVAKAGYLSYLLAEGLYETKIAEVRCSCKSGMKIYWEDETLYLTFEGGEPIPSLCREKRAKRI